MTSMAGQSSLKEKKKKKKKGNASSLSREEFDRRKPRTLRNTRAVGLPPIRFQPSLAGSRMAGPPYMAFSLPLKKLHGSECRFCRSGGMRDR